MYDCNVINDHFQPVELKIVLQDDFVMRKAISLNVQLNFTLHDMALIQPL